MKYHILWQTPDGVEQRVFHEWGWAAEWLSYQPPAPGESYTVFPCGQPGCKDARHHKRTWQNAFDAHIMESARRTRERAEAQAAADFDVVQDTIDAAQAAEDAREAEYLRIERETN